MDQGRAWESSLSLHMRFREHDGEWEASENLAAVRSLICESEEEEEV